RHCDRCDRNHRGSSLVWQRTGPGVGADVDRSIAGIAVRLAKLVAKHCLGFIPGVVVGLLEYVALHPRAWRAALVVGPYLLWSLSGFHVRSAPVSCSAQTTGLLGRIAGVSRNVGFV